MTKQPSSEPRRVVVVSPFFYPEPISTGRYNTHLAQELVRAGAHVDVICSHPLYPGWVPRTCSDDLPGVRIHRAGARVPYPKSVILRRLVLELWFAWHARRTIRANIAVADLVICVMPPVAFPLLPTMMRPKGARCVALIHDIVGVMAAVRRNPLRRAVARAMAAIERASLDRCDHVICLSDSMRSVLLETYGLSPERISVAYPFETPIGSPSPSHVVDDLLADDAFHVVYSGALGEKQMPEQLVGAMKLIASTVEGVDCHIFSGGPIFERLRAEHSAADSRVRFHDLVDEAYLARLYERSMIQIVPVASGSDCGAFPSKLPNLIAAGVPVLAFCEPQTEVAHIIDRAKAGFWCDPADTGRLRSIVESLIEESRVRTRQQRREEARDVVESLFSLPRLARRILTLADRDSPAVSDQLAPTSRPPPSSDR